MNIRSLGRKFTPRYISVLLKVFHCRSITGTWNQQQLSLWAYQEKHLENSRSLWGEISALSNTSLRELLYAWWSTSLTSEEMRELSLIIRLVSRSLDSRNWNLPRVCLVRICLKLKLSRLPMCGLRIERLQPLQSRSPTLSEFGTA